MSYTCAPSSDLTNKITFVRSLSSKTNDKVIANIDQIINEIFRGRIDVKGETIELFGMPSTAITDNANVAMASQIYSRGHDEDVYKNTHTYSAFYSKRAKNSAADGLISWIGCPSIVFSYKSRIRFKEIIPTTCVNMLFSLAPFGSTKCVIDQHLKSLKGNKYCTRSNKVRVKCAEPYYRKHGSYSRRASGLVTTLKKTAEILKNEQDELNVKHGKNTAQFYNEMLSYFFPWDVVGIEIGGMKSKTPSKLLSELNKHRQVFIKKLTQLNKKSDQELSNKVNACKINIKNNNIADIDNALFIFTKFIVLCECGAKGVTFTAQDLKRTAGVILDIMNEPLKLFEYGRKSQTDQFLFRELPKSKRMQRKHPFELFVRQKDLVSKSLPITYLKKSICQLKTETLATNQTRKRKSMISKHRTRRAR